MPAISNSKERPPVTANIVEELRRLERAIPAILSGRPLQEVLTILVESAAAAAGAPMGSIFLLDPQDQHLYPGVLVRLPARYAQACARVPVDSGGACGRAVETGKPSVVTDTSTDPLFASFREVAMQNGIRALFSVPIVTADRRILGALANHFSHPHQPAAEDIERNQLYAHLAAAAMEMARAMEETAARAAAEAEVRLREEFIAILGHDLRSPLGAISAGAHHLLDERNLTDLQRRIAARISTSAARMARLVDQLMDIARSRLGSGMPVDRQAVDLHRICRQVTEEMQASHPECSIQIQAEGNTWGIWDPDRLAQLVSNLVGNAIQHGYRGRPIVLRIHGEGAWLTLEISNQGPEIPPESLPALFEPFREGTQRSAGTGLGLGLYISREITRAHGGRIEACSSGDRTTFRVELPHAPGAGSQQRLRARRPRG